MLPNIKQIAFLLPLLMTSLVVAQTDFTTMASHEAQTSAARLEAGPLINGNPSLAVVFQGTDDLHYYATAATAPAPDLQLQVTADADGLTFGDTVYPKYQYFNDPAQGRTPVFVGNFTVLIPMLDYDQTKSQTTVEAQVTGITCTSQLCLPPFSKTLTADIDLTQWPQITVTPAAAPVQKSAQESLTPAPLTETSESGRVALGEALANWQTIDATDAGKRTAVWWYFLLAILAGLSINIMPCVLPVIPLIILRLVSQVEEAPAKRLALGFSFCGGIVLFFAVFAFLSAMVKLAFGVALDLNSLYRNPAAVITLFLFILFFALVLLDLLTLTLPASVSNRQGRALGGFWGSVGMGFFAGVLSTPCSGAILGAVLVWAQTQPLIVSSIALVLMGIGMALPYAVLVSIPSLLDYVPKPGTWMEIVKKTGGFLLLVIAVKFTLTALPKDRLINVLLYGVIFAFCVWMWGSWVGFNTQRGRKWATRVAAVAIAVGFGIWLLPPAAPSAIAWQSYNAEQVAKAVAKGRPVVIKFTADWCTNCKIVEQRVYQQPEVAELIARKDILAVKADTTLASYPASQDLNEVFGEAGSVPLTVVLDPADNDIIKLRGIFELEKLKQILNDRF